MTVVATPIAPDILRQAAAWMAHLGSGEADADDMARLRAWRAAHADHEHAWQRASALGARLRVLPTHLAMPVLDRELRLDRRTALKHALGVAALLPLGGWAWRTASIDHRTGIGERAEVQLADGSLLQLDTDTAIRVQGDGASQRITLLQGELHLDAAQASTTMIAVHTAAGHIGMTGSRGRVRLEDTATRVAVDAGARTARVETATGIAAPVAGGQQVRFDPRTISAPFPVPEGSDGWREGLLYADAQSLATFLSELARYRAGWLRCDPAVAALRISGVFRLDDTDHVLQVLTRTLPVRIARRNRWWVSVEPA